MHGLISRSLPYIDQFVAPFWPDDAPFVADGCEVTGTFERQRREKLRSINRAKKHVRYIRKNSELIAKFAKPSIFTSNYFLF